MPQFRITRRPRHGGSDVEPMFDVDQIEDSGAETRISIVETFDAAEACLIAFYPDAKQTFGDVRSGIWVYVAV